VQGQSEVDMSVYRCAFRGGGWSEVDLTMDQPVRVQSSSSTLGRSSVVIGIGAIGFGHDQAPFIFLFYFTSGRRRRSKACLPLVCNARRKVRGTHHARLASLFRRVSIVAFCSSDLRIFFSHAVHACI
jgi:hypothetical protein